MSTLVPLQIRTALVLRAVALCAVLCAPVARAESWLLVPEAPVTIVRGTSKFEADQPVAVETGDLLATDGQHGAQIEDDHGTIAALGHSTRVGVETPASRDATGSLALSLLAGWLKVARVGEPAAAQVTIDTSALRAVLEAGSAVIQGSGSSTAIFVETGNLALTFPDAPDAALSLGSDHYLQRDAGQSPVQSGRPAPAFVSGLPANFRDPLAPIARAHPVKAVPPPAGMPVTYADIADWLGCSLPVRRTFVTRFRALARTEPFRSDLRAHLHELPEWRPVLYPPRVQPHRRSTARPPAEAT
jgi:hypothetical protein